MKRKRTQKTPKRLDREVFQVYLPPRTRYRDYKFEEKVPEEVSNTICEPIFVGKNVKTNSGKLDQEEKKKPQEEFDVFMAPYEQKYPKEEDDHSDVNQKDTSGQHEERDFSIIQDEESCSLNEEKVYGDTKESVEEQETDLKTEDENQLDRHCDKILPAKLQLNLSNSEWRSIYSQDVSYKLVEDWTNVLASKLSEHIPECTWVFKKNRLKKTDSRKTTAPFFRGKAICNRPECSVTVLLLIQTEPTMDDIEMSASISGKQNHVMKQAKRQLRGMFLSKTASQASQQGTMNFYYDRLAEMSSEQIKVGNITHCQTPTVLRKAVSEWVQKDFLHRDIIQEVLLLKEAYIDNDTSNVKTDYPGYIQHVSADPFTVILFSKDQLDILGTHRNGDYYLDATGTIIRTIPGQTRPLLYSLVLKISEAPSLSVADMITTNHTIPNILHFLMVVRRAASERKRLFQPRKVETNFSWAQIQSALIAFNNHNVKRYINACWQICNQKTNAPDLVEQFTVLHLCSSHMTKALRNSIQCHAGTNKELANFAMNSFAKLCNSTSLGEAQLHFVNFCRVLISPTLSQEVREATSLINKSESTIIIDDEKAADYCDIFMGRR